MSRRKKTVFWVTVFISNIILFLLVRLSLLDYWHYPHSLMKNILVWGILSVGVIVGVVLRRYLRQETTVVEDNDKTKDKK